MKQETKSVSRVVLRDNILDQIKHAEFYKTFREMLASEYKEQEQAFFKGTWIEFSLNNKKGCWNKKSQVAVPVQNVYAKLADTYFDIECAEITEETIVSLFDSKSECSDEIMQGIKASQAFQDGHWIGFAGGSFCVETERYSNWNDTDSVQVGYVSIKTKEFKQAILSRKYEILTDDTLKQAVAVLKQRSVAEVS